MLRKRKRMRENNSLVHKYIKQPIHICMFSGMRKRMNTGEEMSYEVNASVHLAFALMLIIASTPGCHMPDITH